MLQVWSRVKPDTDILTRAKGSNTDTNMEAPVQDVP